jgi:hypothetical protein
MQHTVNQPPNVTICMRAGNCCCGCGTQSLCKPPSPPTARVLSAVCLQGDHIPLPPIVLTAFLCVYAGFNLGELRAGSSSSSSTAARPAQRQQAGAGAAAAVAGSSSQSCKTPSKAEKKQQKKHA